MKYPWRSLTMTCLLVLLTAAPLAAQEERQWYHLSIYQLTSEERAAAFDKAFKAVLPVVEGTGVGPVGVFVPTETKPDDPGILRYVLMPLSLPSDLIELYGKVAASDALAEARDYLDPPKESPSIQRVEASLFYAFEGMPRLEIPGKPAEGQKRLFELRVYESFSEAKGKLKVEMFNRGELDIFKEVGLDGVFFGEAIAGPNLPNLTYMLVYDDEAHKDKVWNAFREAESWKQLRENPRYKDTVSNIISRFLRPTDYSQIQ